MQIDDSHIQVSVLNEQEVKVDPLRLAEVARRTAIAQQVEGEISITLVDRKRIARLNEVWMGEDGPTDVLSFPVDGFVARATKVGDDRPPVVIGEIVLCPEVAGTSDLEGLDEELDLLVAHGVLHLLGFDHETEQAARQMREYEFEITGRSGASAEGGFGGVVAPLGMDPRAPEAANPPKSSGGFGGVVAPFGKDSRAPEAANPLKLN